MKSNFLVPVAIIAAAAMTLASCNSEKSKPENLQTRDAVVSIDIAGTTDTKAVVNALPTDDGDVKDLAIFVFRVVSTTDETQNVLDGSYYSSTPTLTGIRFKTTPGKRNIYVVANTHGASFSNAVNESAFKAISSSLLAESQGSFTMVGKKTGVTLAEGSGAANTMTINISRMVARIMLTGIEADFTGTLLAGEQLTEVKAYLTNVWGSKYYCDSSATTSGSAMLNLAKDIPANYAGETMTGTLCDLIVGSIGAGANANSERHYFYAYSNTSADNAATPFTRLVIQGKVKGITYYWPININREGYRNASPGHDGILPNHTYEYTVKITRIGSDNPDVLVSTSNMQVSLNVVDWIVVPAVNYEF